MSSINLANTFVQGLSDNITHINYLTRAAVRTPGTPKDRQLDYFWRDAFLSIATIYAFDATYTLTEGLYTNPQIVRNLGLHKLAKTNGEALKALHPDWSPKELAKRHNFSRLPIMLEDFGTQDLIDPLIPERFATTLAETLKAKPNHPNREKLVLLQQQLFKKMNYEQFLARYQSEALNTLGLTPKQISGHVDTLFNKVIPEAAKHAETQWSKPSTWLNGLYFNNSKQIKQLETKQFRTDVQKHLKPYLGKLPVEVKHHQQLEALLLEGLKSKRTMMLLKHLKGSHVLPGLILGLGINTMHFGVFGNYMDFNVVQPWQKKLTKEFGGVNQLMWPAYLAIIPWAITFLGLKSGPAKLGKLLPNVGLLQRFGISTLLGMGVYTASTVGFIKIRLNQMRNQMKKEKASGKVAARAVSAPVSQQPVQNQNNPFQQGSVSYKNQDPSFLSLKANPKPGTYGLSLSRNVSSVD
jgi:hypothetical protein